MVDVRAQASLCKHVFVVSKGLSVLRAAVVRV